MKLIQGELFWPGQTRPAPSSAALDSDVRCDALVVGAGITGALVTRELVRSGVDVVVVDRGAGGCGSTAASTALLIYELDTPLHQLIGLVGKPRAVRAYQLGVQAIGRFEQLVADLGDDCGFARARGLYVAKSEQDLADLKAEVDARRSCGLNVEFLSAEDLSERSSIRRPGAILSHDAAQADPYRLTRRVLEDAVRGGARLFEHTEVSGAQEEGGGVRAVTARGPSIQARHVIYATGYAAAHRLPDAPAEAYVTYAAVSEPLSVLPFHGERYLLWETARPYLYLRTTTDGRALIGGEDDRGIEPCSDPNRLAQKRRKLEATFTELFPSMEFRTAKAWAAVFETTPDSLAYIGPHPLLPGRLFALGYGGNGMTFAMIAADILRDLCLGKPNADAQIFRFGRGADRG